MTNNTLLLQATGPATMQDFGERHANVGIICERRTPPQVMASHLGHWLSRVTAQGLEQWWGSLIAKDLVRVGQLTRK